MQPGKTKSQNRPLLTERPILIGRDAWTGRAGGKNVPREKGAWTMQVREPRMAENRASAVIDSSEKFLSLRGQGEIFLHWCLVRKIEFSPLSLCSAIEKYYFWAAVQQAGCFISICVTPIAFSTIRPLVHVVEKAIGVMHFEMKHPAGCTTAQKSFLNLQDFLYLMENKIVCEVDRVDKHCLRESADCRAQICLVSGTNALLICIDSLSGYTLTHCHGLSPQSTSLSQPSVSYFIPSIKEYNWAGSWEKGHKVIFGRSTLWTFTFSNSAMMYKPLTKTVWKN